MKQEISPPAARQHGRTLLEVLIAMAIGLIILTALGVVYLTTTRTDRQSTNVTRMTEDAAIAFQLLGDNLRMAGYSTPRRKNLPGQAIYGGRTVRVADGNYSGVGVIGCDHGFVNLAADDVADLECADSGGSAEMVIRFEGDLWNTVPISGGPSDCLNQEVTVVAKSEITDEPYALIDSRFSAGGSGDDASLSCAGNGNSFIPGPLIQYVEQMQLRYGVDDNDSGRVTRYASASEIGDPSSVHWEDVVSIRVCLLLRSQNRDESDSNAYTDCDGSTATSADGYLRRAFTTVYALRNRIALPEVAVAAAGGGSNP